MNRYANFKSDTFATIYNGSAFPYNSQEAEEHRPSGVTQEAGGLIQILAEPKGCKTFSEICADVMGGCLTILWVSVVQGIILNLLLERI